MESNLTDSVALSNGVVVAIPPLPAFGERVNNFPNANTNNQFYKMLNKHKREVPVDASKVTEYLGRGYVHTDGKVYRDDPSFQVQPPEPAPDLARVMTEFMTQMAKKEEKKK